MTKNVKFNVDISKTLAKNVKNDDLREKADNLVKLFADRKLSQKTMQKNK